MGAQKGLTKPSKFRKQKKGVYHMNDNNRLLHLICIVLLMLACALQQFQIDKLVERIEVLEEAALTEHQRNILGGIEWMLSKE